jgi:hypothetical protein
MKWFLVVGVVLAAIGLVITLKNRSPYSKTLMDDQTRSRQRVGQVFTLAGTTCSLIAWVLRHWG